MSGHAATVVNARARLVAALAEADERPTHKAPAVKVELATAVYAQRLRMGATELRDALQDGRRRGLTYTEALAELEGPL